MNAWIDELERDLGLPARLRVVANTSGQSREIPHPENARKPAPDASSEAAENDAAE